jgi:carbonic anhydrase
MKIEIERLFENNKQWVEKIERENPTFFRDLAEVQNPQFLWIGCSDSRVSANQTVGLMPGELFVHRNIANLVVHTDLNSLSVIQFAVDVLKVKHIIVCGHYGCGGVKSAMSEVSVGFIDNWLQHIRDVWDKHQTVLVKIVDKTIQFERLCELSVIEQVRNVCNTTIIKDAWKRGQELTVHGWIYQLGNGRIRNLDFAVAALQECSEKYSVAVKSLNGRVAEKKYV